MKSIIITFISILIGIATAFAQYVQEPLPYDYKALEPYIDAQTMEIHYTKHHAAYVKNLNAALKEAGLEHETDLNKIFAEMSKYSDAIRNNGGGHYNHSLFWKLLTSNEGTKPSPELLRSIETTFGDFETFKAEFNKAAASRFGSGWAWLIVTPDKKLAITSTPNQDNPLMDIAEVKGIPVLGIDVWEHAYYLKYQNRRGDYMQAVWNIVNWDEVSTLFKKAMLN